jgi:hypothetical protein
MTKEPIDIGLNKEMIIHILVKGRPVDVSLELDESQKGVVIRAGGKTHRHLIPQHKE